MHHPPNLLFAANFVLAICCAECHGKGVCKSQLMRPSSSFVDAANAQKSKVVQVDAMQMPSVLNVVFFEAHCILCWPVKLHSRH